MHGTLIQIFIKLIMRKKIYILFILCCLTIANCYSQSSTTCPPPPCQGCGPQDPGGGGGGGASGATLGVGSADPNLILSPIGFDTARWVSVNDNMGFAIYFENDPQFATAPAHNVYIYYQFNTHQDATSFRLGNFGFNGMNFTVPPGLNYYQTRVDLRDSLGLYVDLTAGINIITNTAFWIFQSIDPLTNQPPLDPLSGFLPVKDSTLTAQSDTVLAKGEGFVNFTMKPLITSQTRDTIFATAKIVFDVNDTIPTNTEFNTLDALPPASSIASDSQATDSVLLYIHTTDDPGGSGVKEYDLYVSQDSAAYIKYLEHLTNSVINFKGVSGSSYRFITLAADQVGNREPMKSSADAVVHFGSSSKWFADADKDGFGNVLQFNFSAGQPNGYVADSTDCNDSNAAVHPSATEICDSIDNDCDGIVDDSLQTYTYYRDRDGDGYGSDSTIVSCSEIAPAGYVTVTSDCNDTDSTIHPGATEICDSIDNDCDGIVDDSLQTHTYYRDQDGDGYGSDSTVVSCIEIAPAGYVTQAGDCNDGNAAIHPGATEICNAIDDNCNGLTNEGCDTITYYRDWDGDGYGNTDSTIVAVSPPAGYVSQGGDCKDEDASINPGAVETCNRKDDNCDGQTDEGCIRRYYYRDADRDGYGRNIRGVLAIIPPPGYVLLSGDCDDANPAIHPGATEVCNGKDDNCNGQVDEGCITSGRNPASVDKGFSSTNNKGGFNVVVSPVPSNDLFNVFFQGDYSKGKVSLRVFDHLGRLIEQRNNLAIGQTIKIGSGYFNGVYILEVVQGWRRKTIKITKM